MINQLTPSHPILRFLILPVNLLLVAAGMLIASWWNLWVNWVYTVEELTYRYPMRYDGDWDGLVFHWWRLTTYSILGAAISILGLFALCSSSRYLIRRIFRNDWCPMEPIYRKVMVRNMVVIAMGILCFGYLVVTNFNDDSLALFFAVVIIPTILSLTSIPIVFTELYMRRSASLSK